MMKRWFSPRWSCGELKSVYEFSIEILAGLYGFYLFLCYLRPEVDIRWSFKHHVYGFLFLS